MQAAKREAPVKKPSNKGAEIDGGIFGNDRDAKRRKVEDPFGGPLK